MTEVTTPPRPEKIRPFLGQFAWVSAGRLVAAILQAVSLAFAIRSVTPAEFGLLAGVLGIATVAQAGIDMGVPTYISRTRAADGDSGAIATALRFNAITSVCLAGLAAVGLLLAGMFIDDIYLLMLPLALWMSAERNADARLTVAFADGDAQINVLNLVGRRIGSLLVFLALERLGVHAILAFTIGLATAALASSLFANLFIRSRVSAASAMSYRDLLRASWPYWLNSIATQARNLDVVVATALAGATQAGFYSTGSRLTSPLRLLPASLASVLVPAAARADRLGQSTKPLVRTALVLSALMTVVYGALFVFTPTLVSSLLGPAQDDAVAVIRVVLLGLPFAAVASLFGALLQGLGRKHFVGTAATATTVLCLALIAAVAGPFGALGAAAALSATFGVQAAVLVYGFISHGRVKGAHRAA